jgi:hypothetical protein
MVPGSARNWIAVNAVQRTSLKHEMKTKTTSNPGTVLRSRFTSLIAIAVACLSVGSAWTAHAQSPTPTPSDLFASINGPVRGLGGASIYRYTPDGTRSVVASTLYSPRGLVFDNAGNLFVTSNTLDNSGDLIYQATILKISPGGLMSTFASGFPTNFFLSGLVLDNNTGNLFVMAQNNNDPNAASTIYKVTSDGAVSPFGLQSDCFQQGTNVNCSTPGQSLGLALDSAVPPNLYAADSLDKTIYKFTTPAGVRTCFAEPNKFPPSQGPSGLAFDSSGHLFVSATDDPGNGGILEFDSNGTVITSFTGLPTNSGARGLAFDAAGNLFVAEVGFNGSGSGAIQKFPSVGLSPTPSPAPIPITFASGIGAQTNRGPEFLAFAPANTAVASTVTTAVTLTFPEGTGAETTTVTPIASASPMPSPSEFQLGNPPLAFDITAYPTPTTAPIIIAFQVPQSFLDQCGCDVSTLKVLHGTAFEDVTCPIPNPGPTPDPTTNTVYASVSSLSPFVIAKLRYGAQVQQPINADGTSVFSVKRGVIPVKFTLTQDGAGTCALPAATIAMTRTSGGTTGAIDESVYTGSADNGSNFRIAGCQYLYNLSASGLGAGTYRVDIKINGTVVGSASFQLK